MNTNLSKIKVGILGASGYAGAALIRRLLKHSQVDIVAIGSRQYQAEPLAKAWPQFVDLLDLEFVDNEQVIEKSELIFFATPHGVTAPWVNKALQAGKKAIDLSADFRLPPKDFEYWYKQKHEYPELIAKAVYGLVELHRKEIIGKNLIATPGCNSTTAVLGLAPLAFNDLLGEDIIVNIAASLSGAGRGLGLGKHYAEANENMRPYNVAGNHRHTAEVELSLARIKEMGRDLKSIDIKKRPIVSLNPHLVPMTRGIMATSYTKAKADNLNDDVLLEHFQKFYQNDPLVVVQADLPNTKAVYASDRSIVSVRYDKRSKQIVTFAVSDNLAKGAAGQAVQNFNIMNAFNETEGLFLEGIWP